MSSPKEEHLEPKQRFTGYWIPIELSQMDLTKTEQFLLAMIDSLEEPAPNYCFASNTYLSKQMELSESQVSRYITKFKRMGLIEEVCFDGRRRRMRTIKSNWYARIEENSKKELCAHMRRQTTHPCVPSIRKNAIPPIYIEEDNDDDDHACTRAEVLRTFDLKGNPRSSNVSEIINALKEKGFSQSTIKEALERTQSSQGRISNVLKYVESSCKQIDAQNEKKLDNNPKQKEKSCNPHKNSLNKFSKNQISNHSKKQPTITKESTSEEGTLGRPLANWKSLIGLEKKS